MNDLCGAKRTPGANKTATHVSTERTINRLEHVLGQLGLFCQRFPNDTVGVLAADTALYFAVEDDGRYIEYVSPLDMRFDLPESADDIRDLAARFNNKHCGLHIKVPDGTNLAAIVGVHVVGSSKVTKGQIKTIWQGVVTAFQDLLNDGLIERSLSDLETEVPE